MEARDVLAGIGLSFIIGIVVLLALHGFQFSWFLSNATPIEELATNPEEHVGQYVEVEGILTKLMWGPFDATIEDEKGYYIYVVFPEELHVKVYSGEVYRVAGRFMKTEVGFLEKKTVYFLQAEKIERSG